MAPTKPNAKKLTAVKKLVDGNSLNVTFSKRKKGLFNKATELSILSHAETALVITSSTGKLYTCGYPSPDAVIHRFLTGAPPSSHRAAGNITHFDEKVETLRAEYDAVQDKLKEEKKKLQAITEKHKSGVNLFPSWWEIPIEDMGLDDLEGFKKSLESLRVNLIMRQVTEKCNPLPLLPRMSELPPRPLSVAPPPPSAPLTNWRPVLVGCNGRQQVQDVNIESGSTSSSSFMLPTGFDSTSSVMSDMFNSPSFVQY